MYNLVFKTQYLTGQPFMFQSVKSGRRVYREEPVGYFPAVFRWDLGVYAEESVPGHPLKKVRVFYNLSNSLFPLPHHVFAWTPSGEPEQVLLPWE